MSDTQRYLSIIQNGLQSKATKPQKVIIVGAGMAGLVAASELLHAGHDPFILEAQHRVGGRVQTLREPFTSGLYAEAGAMRVPQSHTLTLAYIEKFKLKLNPFTMNNRNAFYYVGNQRHRIDEAHIDPDCLGFEINENEHHKSPGQMWAEAIKPITDKLEAKGDAAWPEIFAEYDKYSTRQFLQNNNWSEGAIEMFGLLENQESRMEASFLEALLASVGHVFEDMWQIEGGSDRLPYAFLPELRRRIRFGANMVAIDQSEDSVTVHYQTPGGRFQVTGDYAIITIPFSVLRHVEILKPFSRGKQRAIRQLRYDASTKVFFQCRRRFWEEDDGIFGGGSVTDLAIRNIYYAEHGREFKRGIMIASYTWADDAHRWGSLTPNQRIAQALENVAQIHPQINEEFEVGASKVWHEDEFACGAFALFNPGQQTVLHEHIIAPEGRIHFAGEHTAILHRWIQSAIETGLRAAEAIHQASNALAAGGRP